MATQSDLDLGRCRGLSDAELVDRFEACTLPADAFGHVDHVRLAFVYLGTHGLLETIRLYRDGLRRFAAHHGAPDRYHETVTWALVILIHQRMAESASLSDWPTFAAAHPDLMRFRGGAFFDYYAPEVLESEMARLTFVLPEGRERQRRGSVASADVS